MKILRWLLIVVVLVLALVVFAGYAFLKSTLPEYEGEVTVAGLTAEVEVIRDSYGMPHIYATSDNDAYFALGYCMAQDRLFQMDLVRRTVNGRLAEIFGEQMLEADQLFLSITAAKRPDEMVQGLPPDVIGAMEAFAAGVNQYLQQGAGLPIDFMLAGYEPARWKPADCAAVLYYMAWMLNFSFDTEILHAAIIDHVGEELARPLFVDYPEGYPTIIPDTNVVSSGKNLKVLQALNLVRELVGGEGRGASNSWVISGDKSETGMPLLANDMHLGLGLPCIWYEAHLVSPSLNVSGVIAPGIPFVVVGANEHVAWGFTNVMADDADYYRERINPDDSMQYEYQGTWERMRVVEDMIPVKGTEDVRHYTRLTNHGPVIRQFNKLDTTGAEAISMRWTIYDLHREAQALYVLNRAGSVADVDSAVQYFKCPGQNWVYADDQGNIGFRAAVAIPIREGFDGALPVPGWDGEFEWAGYVPTADQPNLANPSRGWIASANNKHTGDDYPHPISHYYAMPDRIARIERMLEEKDKLGIDDFARMHADTYEILAEEWAPVMLAALADDSLTEIQARARDILADWDYDARPDAVAPSIFHATVNHLITHVFADRLGEELYSQYIRNVWRAHNALRELIAGQDTVWFDNPATSEREDLSDVLRAGFAEAIEELQTGYGEDTDAWRWGDLHTLTLSHPIGRALPVLGGFFNAGPYSMGGGVSTVNPSPYRLTRSWQTFAGASMRYIIDLQNPDNSRRIIPGGISGNFMSPHYKNQVEAWWKVEYRPFVLRRGAVEKDAAFRMKLIPQ